MLLGAGHLHQHLAGLHPLAILEVDGGDRLGDVGGEGDGLARLQRPQGLHRVREGFQPCLGDDDRDGLGGLLGQQRGSQDQQQEQKGGTFGHGDRCLREIINL
jgi:hypothetical protein